MELSKHNALQIVREINSVLPQTRQYVYLFPDKGTAVAVVRRQVKA